MLRICPVLVFAFCWIMNGCASPKMNNTGINDQLSQSIDETFRMAAEQYTFLMQQLPPGRFPKTWFPASQQYEWSGSDWWCSGFYPGSLFYLFEQTKDSALYHEATRMLGLLEKEQYNTGTHDLGFMMFCSFGNAFRIAPADAYRQIIINSAKSLSTRFSPVTGCIRSWNSTAPGFLVIIDNMMNLELLFEATRLSGDSSFYKIAVAHANTTMKNHFRTDHSSWHVLDYDERTGTILSKRTAQGYSNESAWARGQAWGLYGFTVAWRETKDAQYLQQANSIAQFILNHPRLPADKIPYWDFDAPDIPHALRDVSAAAITASALLELSRYVKGKMAKQYWDAAKQILVTFSSPVYRADGGTNGGFLLKHGVGHYPNHTEVDVPLTYADYYFIEAMVRYKKWNHSPASNSKR